MISMRTLSFLLLGSTLTFACTDAVGGSTQALGGADAADPADGNRPPPGPPPKEAVDACADLAEQDSCSFTHDGHAVDGTCRRGPDGSGPLACAPDHPPGPPQAALDACDGADAGDACDFACGADTMTGTCRLGPDDAGPLACAPDQAPPAP